MQITLFKDTLAINEQILNHVPDYSDVGYNLGKIFGNEMKMFVASGNLLLYYIYLFMYYIYVCLFFVQVKTRLENPTKYHVQQNQKRQVEMYLSHSMGKTSTIHSLPTMTFTHSNNLSSTDPASVNAQSSTSAPMDPDSPLYNGFSSTATSLSETNVSAPKKSVSVCPKPI